MFVLGTAPNFRRCHHQLRFWRAGVSICSTLISLKFARTENATGMNIINYTRIDNDAKHTDTNTNNPRYTHINIDTDYIHFNTNSKQNIPATLQRQYRIHAHQHQNT